MAVQRIDAGDAQHGAAARAVAAQPGRHRRNDLEQPAARALAQLRLGHPGARRLPRVLKGPVSPRGGEEAHCSSVAMPSASSPTRVADRRHQARRVRGGERLGDGEGARRRPPRPVELGGDLGDQDQRARLVGVEPLDVDADDAVVVGGDGAAFGVDRAAGQALRQLDDQHAPEQAGQRLAPPVVGADVELVTFRRAHDLAAVEVARQARCPSAGRPSARAAGSGRCATRWCSSWARARRRRPRQRAAEPRAKRRRPRERSFIPCPCWCDP